MIWHFSSIWYKARRALLVWGAGEGMCPLTSFHYIFTQLFQISLNFLICCLNKWTRFFFFPFPISNPFPFTFPFSPLSSPSTYGEQSQAFTARPPSCDPATMDSYMHFLYTPPFSAFEWEKEIYILANGCVISVRQISGIYWDLLVRFEKLFVRIVDSRFV